MRKYQIDLYAAGGIAGALLALYIHFKSRENNKNKEVLTVEAPLICFTMFLVLQSLLFFIIILTIMYDKSDQKEPELEESQAEFNPQTIDE